MDAIIADSPDSRYNILKKGISYDDAKAFEAAEKKKIPRSKESGWKRIMSENIHIIHLPAMSWDSAYRGMWEQADWKHPIIQR